jgi:hypothetical protein
VDAERDANAIDRRRFLQVLGFGVTTSLGGTVAALAQGTGGGAAAPKPAAAAAPADSTARPAAPAGPPEISEDARSLAEIVRRRYGKHLTPDQLESVTRELDGRVQGGRRLKDAKLANGDEPDLTFRA